MRVNQAAVLICLLSQRSSVVAFAPSASSLRLFGSSVLYNDKAARHDVGGSPLGTPLVMCGSCFSFTFEKVSPCSVAFHTAFYDIFQTTFLPNSRPKL
jgi:hypothetical protein